MRKLKSNSGESILEALVTTVIVTLCVAFLVTAVVTAGKINKKYETQNVDLKYGGTQDAAYSILITYQDGENTSQWYSYRKVTLPEGETDNSLLELYVTDNGYVYYKKAVSGS